MITVLKKELARVFKDVKMIFSLFILPVMITVGMFAFMNYISGLDEDDVNKHESRICLVDVPSEVEELLTKNIENAKISKIELSEIEGKKEEIKKGDWDLIVVFPENFVEGIKDDSGKVIPKITAYYNPTEDYSYKASNEVLSLLEQYRLTKLNERVGSLDVITVFAVEQAEVIDEAKATGKILSQLIPYFVTIMLFATAMGLGIDMFTGEKERGTMNSLLMTPVSRYSIALGKICSLILISILSAVMQTVGMFAGGKFLMSNNDKMSSLNSLKISFSAAQVVELFLIILSLSFVYVVIIAMVGVCAKTVKEASSLVMPVYMIIMGVGLFTMIGSMQIADYFFCIPIMNSSLALSAIFKQELSVYQFILTIVSNLVFAGVITGVIAKLFNNEKIMASN